MTLRFRGALMAVGCVALGLEVATALSQDADPYGADFDPDQPIQFTGQVRELQWVNPRAWLIVVVDDFDGVGPADVAVMLPPPGALERRGWTRGIFTPGDSVTVEGDRARDGKPRAKARRIVAADGTTLLDLDAQPIFYRN